MAATKNFRTDIVLQGGAKVTGLPTPSASSDAATKQYVDAAISGFDYKASARVAAAANVNVNSPGAAIDGVSLSAGDRVLLTGQSTASQNGVWVWNGAAVAMTRPADFAAGQVTAGTLVPVTEGTTSADTLWLLTTNDPITVDTTALAWSKLAPAGSGVSKVSGTLGDGAATLYTITDNLGTTAKNAQVWDVSSGDVVECRISKTTNTTIFEFSTAPASAAIGYCILG